MTIRRQWLRVLILIAIISVVVNSLVLSSLINRYFVDYTSKNYEKHFDQIVAYSKKALSEENYSSMQLAIELEAHLIDPITRIKLYDAQGQLLVEVSNEVNMMGSMMRNKMMNRMMGAPSEEVDHSEIFDTSGSLIGQLNIMRYSSVKNSLETRMFNSALISNSLISIGLVLILALITGLFVSKRMSKDLIDTAALAQSIDLGNDVDTKQSKVREISVIQQSLETLQAKLKLKQKSRKKLIDELVHQTRTPLTILRTHLEGFEDGLINMSSEEIKICENQIDNITSIIENMSSMIDAEKDVESVQLEEFEINQLLNQIMSGLKVQFEKKYIDLALLCSQKVYLKTDKYKLSQSIYNILTNAYKFTPTQGKVSISYETEGDELFITIEDTGIGINSNDQKQLFDAYFRGSKTSNVSGEGIGLFVVKENLKKINGTVSVHSEVGKGSQFSIQIPKRIN